jgi:hypothetical protein
MDRMICGDYYNKAFVCVVTLKFETYTTVFLRKYELTHSSEFIKWAITKDIIAMMAENNQNICVFTYTVNESPCECFSDMGIEITKTLKLNEAHYIYVTKHLSISYIDPDGETFLLNDHHFLKGL